MLTLFFIVIAYLIGSLSSAIIVCRLFGYPDPRTQGSHNPGATNVLRIANKKIAMLVLMGDALKGLLIVLIARYFQLDVISLGFIGYSAVIGHIFPVFFQFKGGKGVATAIGALAAMAWPIALIVIGIWLAVFYFSRISSLSALTATLCTPIACWFFNQNLMIPVSILSLTLLISHHENIKRLINQEEKKLKK